MQHFAPLMPQRAQSHDNHGPVLLFHHAGSSNPQSEHTHTSTGVPSTISVSFVITAPQIGQYVGNTIDSTVIIIPRRLFLMLQGQKRTAFSLLNTEPVTPPVSLSELSRLLMLHLHMLN